MGVFYFLFPLNILCLDYIHAAKHTYDFILSLFIVGHYFTMYIHMTQSIVFWSWTFGLFPDVGSSDRCYHEHLCADLLEVELLG